MKKLYNRYDKYEIDFDFDKASTDEVLIMLEKQAELTLRKDLSIMIRAIQFLPEGMPVTVNDIIADKTTPYHMHDFCEINLVLDGTLAEYINGEKYVLHTGDILIMNPNIYHASHPVGKTTAKNILLSDSLIKNVITMLSANKASNYLAGLIKSKEYLIFRDTENTELWQTVIELCKIFSSSENKTAYKKAKSKNLAEKLLIELADRECTGYHVANSEENEFSRDTRILDYITEHYNKITLLDVANHFGYSEQQIRRIVRKNTGLSYSMYLRNYRITKASILLSETTVPINEIAHTIGYDSPEHFSRLFKDEKDLSPMQYRLYHQNKP